MAKEDSHSNGHDRGGARTDSHLVLNGKGGVGKSLVARWLAEFLFSRGLHVHCIDGDPVNRSLSQYKALAADPNAQPLVGAVDLLGALVR